MKRFAKKRKIPNISVDVVIIDDISKEDANWYEVGEFLAVPVKDKNGNATEDIAALYEVVKKTRRNGWK